MRAKNKPMPRTFQINIRLNETEYNNLSRSAALKGLERAAYVRMLMLKDWRERNTQKAD